MATFNPIFVSIGSPSSGLGVFAREALALFKALLGPGAVIREVEQMRAWQQEADRIEASDPVRAAALRRLAAQACMQ